MGCSFGWALWALLLAGLMDVPAAWDQENLLLDVLSEDASAWVTQVRRDLHQIPELQFNVTLTSAYVRSRLDKLNISYQYPIAEHGIVARLGSGKPVVALRSDMDGLPIEEVDTLDAGLQGWASHHTGRMHACGHDAHMAMLLGAARVLKAHEKYLKGTVVLVFQPAEEGGGGAAKMIDEGALQGVQAMSGLHVWPALPSGTIATKPGPIMAASDRFVFKVQGRGGHGAMPHLSADPVVASAAIILALQTLVSRETSPTDSAVVTVGIIDIGVGGACNIIPDAVEIQGTIRALSMQHMKRLQARVEEVARGTAAVYGCNLTQLAWSEVMYPPTVNDDQLAALAVVVAGRLAKAADELRGSSISRCKGSCSLDDKSATMPQADGAHLQPGVEAKGGVGMCDVEGAAQCEQQQGEPAEKFAVAASRVPTILVQQLNEPSMAAEDFSFYCLKVPAVFSFLGIGNPEIGTETSLHNPRFQMDESMLPVGVALHVAMALEMLDSKQLVANS